MRTLFINIVKVTTTECVLKVYLRGFRPGHYHTLRFSSYELMVKAMDKFRSKNQTVERDCATGYIWTYKNNERKFISTITSNLIYLGIY